MALPLFEEPRPPRVPVVRIAFYPIRVGTPEMVEYLIQFRRGVADDAPPRDVPGDPVMTYASQAWLPARQTISSVEATTGALT